jgi:hypothetical protein
MTVHRSPQALRWYPSVMAEPQPPRPPVGVPHDLADDVPRGELGPPLAPPPVETPGPSVTPPLLPESDTEREEWADRTRPDAEAFEWVGPKSADPVDELVAEEESAAMAEARLIGGPVHHDGPKPELDPVYEAGGGEQDGWDLAEADLIENASHGDGYGNPLRDMLSPELESDRSPAEYGEPDEEDLDDRW